MFAVVTAQGYVRIDTVIRPYIDLDYQSWIDSNMPLVIDHKIMSFNHYGMEALVYGDQVQYNYIAGGADIYGLEVWMNYLFGSIDPTTLSPSFPEYLYLYDARPDSFELKAQVMLVNVDPFTDQWNGWYHYRYIDTICKDFQVKPSSHMNRYQYYFDSPIHVDDSFYVGGSSMFFRWDEMSVDAPAELPPHVIFFYGYMSSEAFYNMDPSFPRRGDDCQLPYMKKKVRWGDEYIPGGRGPSTLNPPMPVGEWVECPSRDFWMIFPLIKTYDTIWEEELPACYPVTGFSIMSRFGDTVILRWNPLEGRNEYQVSYGPLGTDPDSGTFEYVTTNRWRYIDTLHTGDVMVAYVRTVCREFDTLRYSDWSEGVEWQTRNAGIMPPLLEQDGLADGVRLMPNPATDGVVLLSNYWMKGVDIYHANGMKYGYLMPQPYTVEFSVKNWPKGMYLIVVHTLVGDLTKKLVVE